MFLFSYNEELYCFTIFDRPIEDAPYLYQLNLEMIRRGSLVHEIILNRDKNAITMVNDIPYILMRIYINMDKKIDLSEMIYITVSNSGIKPNNMLDRSDWSKLWASKIDYFEYQISQVGKKYPIICEYLGYYIGLAENALMYVKDTIKEVSKSPYDNLTISHRRIRLNDTAFDIYNPLSFVIDYQIRDLAEYIKSVFFSGEDVWKVIDEYFRNYDLSIFDRRLLYARLVYPSYFFDAYDDVMDEKVKEESIMPIVYKSVSYEDFLREFYIYINKGNVLPKIDWLNKKNSF
jgi:spore coat protein YutH